MKICIKLFALSIMLLVIISCNKDNLDNPPAPIASFTDSVIGTLPVIVNFANTSTAPGVNYLWRFGDGTISTVTNPIHSYDSFASYLVTFVQTSALGVSDSVTKSIN